MIRSQIAEALQECPEGPLKVISLCSGDGRDLLDVLPGHPRRADASCFLIDRNPEAIADAKETVRTCGLENQVTCFCGDAALLEHCADFVPADLIIVSGVFAHLTLLDAGKLIAALPMLCRPGAFVLWNRRELRGRFNPESLELHEYFRRHGFVTVDQVSSGEEGFLLIRERYNGEPKPWAPGPSLFTFINRSPGGGRQSIGQRLRAWFSRRTGL